MRITILACVFQLIRPTYVNRSRAALVQKVHRTNRAYPKSLYYRRILSYHNLKIQRLLTGSNLSEEIHNEYCTVGCPRSKITCRKPKLGNWQYGEKISPKCHVMLAKCASDIVFVHF